MEKSRFLIQIPAADTDIVEELLKIPNASRTEEDRLDGAEIVKILVEVAFAAKAVASTSRSISSATKEAATTIATLRSIFSKGVTRHKRDPGLDFVVLKNGEPFVSSDMAEADVAKRLDRMRVDQ